MFTENIDKATIYCVFSVNMHHQAYNTRVFLGIRSVHKEHQQICHTLCIFSDVEGMLRRANNTEFGLASGVFTKNIDKALHVADSLQAGTVFINTYNKTDVAAPFGGFKQSGFGKDLGKKRGNPLLSDTCW